VSTWEYVVAGLWLVFGLPIVIIFDRGRSSNPYFDLALNVVVWLAPFGIYFWGKGYGIIFALMFVIGLFFQPWRRRR
jgi:hypothetical protein